MSFTHLESLIIKRPLNERMRNSLAIDDTKFLSRLESSPSDVKDSSSEDGNYNQSLEEEDQFLNAAAQP